MLKTNYSEGIAITSIFHADDVTTIEPVRYPAGSSLMRFLDRAAGRKRRQRPHALLQDGGANLHAPDRFCQDAYSAGLGAAHDDHSGHADRRQSHPLAVGAQPLHGVAQESGLQTRCRSHHSQQDRHRPSRSRARLPQKTNGIPAGSLNEGLLNIPMTAHILGGVPFGVNDQRRRGRSQLRNPQLSRPVRRRWIDRAGESRRESQPHDHGAGRVRHEPCAGEARRAGTSTDWRGSIVEICP